MFRLAFSLRRVAGGVAFAAAALHGASHADAADCIGADDGFEPNDSIVQAAPLGGTTILPRLLACDGDVDFFSLPLVAGETVMIDVTFSDAFGDLNAVLFDLAVSDIDPVETSLSLTDNERLLYTAPTDTTVVLHVFGVGGDENEYDLLISKGDPSTITYQGHLEQDGAPATGKHDFRFSLYGDETGGASFAERTVSKVPVLDGLFAVDLTFDASLDTRGAFWIEATVLAPSGDETLAPRVRYRPAVVASRLVPGSMIQGGEGTALAINGAGDVGLQIGWSGLGAGQANAHGILVERPAVGLEIEGHSVGGIIVGEHGAGGQSAVAVDTSNNLIGFRSVDNSIGLSVSGTDDVGVFVGTPVLGFAAEFNGDVEITGGCLGCRQAVRALNVSGGAIAPGQAAAIAGVDVSLGVESPRLMIKAAEAGDAILGVVESRLEELELPVGSEKLLGGSPPIQRTAGLIEHGHEALVITSGLVLVELAGKASVQVGDTVGLAGAGLATVRSGPGRLGIVAAPPSDETAGKAWVMLRLD